MNLEPLFHSKIIKQQKLHEDEDHIGGASEIWIVKTEWGETVVRTSNIGHLEDEKFWLGCNELYGVDPRNVFRLEEINKELSNLTQILSIPTVLSKAKIDKKEYVSLTKLEGKQLVSFLNLSPQELENLGKALAEIHSEKFDFFGSSSRDLNSLLKNFNLSLLRVMEILIDKFYTNVNKLEDKGIKETFKKMYQLVAELSHPQSASYIMIDLDPSQFLIEDNQISSIVDTEGYAIGPREFDFIALEYLLDAESVQFFIKGYSSKLDIPDLTQVRPVYRFFYRLLTVQGSVPIDEWLNQPILFK
ncbi:hypothetical protein QCQ60_004957 [Bacillus cereus]|nr:hypothetical protein [Bacillus cereus]